MITRKQVKSWVPCLPLLAIAAIPFNEIEVWRRVIILIPLALTYLAMTRLGESQ